MRSFNRGSNTNKNSSEIQNPRRVINTNLKPVSRSGSRGAIKQNVQMPSIPPPVPFPKPLQQAVFSDTKQTFISMIPRVKSAANSK